ncbi:MAG TPA: cobalt transporter CbiM, partial [Longilinea sp.]|nr:cobalt transporter CbiM [Longilinea sp.]
KVPRKLILYYAAAAVWLATTAMHIPDGYLSPATSIVMFILVLPFWAIGVKKLREKISAKTIPLVALFAAFTFVIMMFNVPLPGGTTGHAVGGALAAIILGPEIATISISIALIIQAVLFGDGGILAIGANCFNMAVVLPYVAYAIYQWITKNHSVDSKRRIWAAGIAGWVSLTVAAFFTAVEFGIQPAIAHSADGIPLYAPYPLSIAISAMLPAHMLVASVIEGVVTALIIAYLIKANQPALEIINKPVVSADTSKFSKWRGLWIGLAVLVIATPLGLLAPGTAWGEWGANELSDLGLSFIPAGLERLSSLWSAPVPDYDLPALGNVTIGYVLSALVGILVTIGVVWLFSMLITAGKKESAKKKES